MIDQKNSNQGNPLNPGVVPEIDKNSQISSNEGGSNTDLDEYESDE